MGGADYGWSTASAPLATPNDYFEVPVAAEQDTAYTLRFQTREDGVRIDQVVLSPVTYATRAPGGATNDATLLPKTTAAPAGTGPYLGSAVTLPGTIDAQDFDHGGEGVACHDTTRGNTGGAYRATDVDLEGSTGGGNNIGWIDPGEWVNYSVTVAAAGAYTVQLRVASPSGGGSLHVGFNASNVWRVVQVPSTGGWQTWTTVNLPVTLTAGPQLLTLLFDTGGFNISRITVAGGTTSGGSTSTSPYGGAPAAIPGTIETERFDTGVQGAALRGHDERQCRRRVPERRRGHRERQRRLRRRLGRTW